MLNKDIVSKYLKPLAPVPTPLHPRGKLREKVKSVLFDIYGTLFISGTGDVSTARKEMESNLDLERLLLKFGIKKRPEVLLKNLYNAVEEKHHELKEAGIDYPEIEIDRIWADILKLANLDVIRNFAAEFELIVNPVYPMPHLEELLSACSDKKIQMGIISNAQFYTSYLFRWFLNADPEDFGFHKDLLLYSYRFGYAKPSKHMFYRAIDKLKTMGIPAHTVLYLGNDMLNDIFAAKTVGFKTALFAGDARSLRLRKDDPRCRDLSPDIIITDLIQLVDYL